MSDIKASGALSHLLDGLARELMRTSAADCEQAATALSNKDTVAHQALGAAVREVSDSRDKDDPQPLWDRIYQAAQQQKRERTITLGRTSWRRRQDLLPGPAEVIPTIPE